MAEFPIDNFIEDLRMSVMDFPEENELLLEFEFKDELVKLALRRAINRINSTRPVFGYKMKLEHFSIVTGKQIGRAHV